MIVGWKLCSWPGSPQPLVGHLQPDVRPIGPRRYRLVGDYMVILFSDTEQLGRLTIFHPFEFDGASVPRVAWSVVGLRPDGLIRAGSTVHDYLYAQRGRVQLVIGGVMTHVDISRADADRIFLDLMLGAGVATWRAKLAYKAVRAFGPRW